jgi:hypothetical protein
MQQANADILQGKSVLIGLLIGPMVGALLGIVFVSQLDPIFAMPEEFANYPVQPSAEYMLRYDAAHRFMLSNNYAIYFATLGGLMGLGIGTVSGGTKRFAAMIASCFSGLVFGALGGFLSGLTVAGAIKNSGEAIPILGLSMEPIVQTTLMHSFAWAVVGIGVGLGFVAATTRSIGRGILVGVLAGILSGVVYTLLAAIAFPNANGFLVLPYSLPEKLTWAACGGICLGATTYHVLGRNT